MSLGAGGERETKTRGVRIISAARAVYRELPTPGYIGNIWKNIAKFRSFFIFHVFLRFLIKLGLPRSQDLSKKLIESILHHFD